MRSGVSRAVRAAGVALAAAVLVLLPAAPALAHVLLESAQPNGDGSVTLTFSFDHGCDGAPTEALVVRMPSGSSALSAGQPGGWRGAVKGNTVEWTGPGLADGTKASFTVRARLSGKVGAPLLFPTTQRCTGGKAYEWIGADDASQEPAPRLIATAAVLDPGLSPAPPPAVGADGADDVQVAVALGAFTALAALTAHLTRRRLRRP
ncbi:hypothetical protein Aph01nite_19160 [Acrocarpospora phusangensis]|uniref:YncI copper-binding domain-containing protein n=1 Tax=Acrocarpospora phusangensis TaxID=1070424 RepID=A0A919Q7H2_9ACTN|nr:DUF1775 domain-containing protein [Acrocarpospora phusangensis]GIH23606.1 hypothetical protein Aph01nite_19160 [Acrocarpospora phusangensis]